MRIGIMVVLVTAALSRVGFAYAQPTQTIFGPVQSVPQSKQPAKPVPPILRRILQNERERWADDDSKATVLVRWAELRPTGNIIVYISGGAGDLGSGYCPTSGCDVEIFEPRGKSYRKIGDIQAWAPIWLLPASLHGQPDLAVWTQGGGVYPGYYARTRFDGRHYPVDGLPVFTPKLKGKVSGKLLIGTNDPGAPLYP